MPSPGQEPKFRAIYDHHFDQIARYCLRRLREAEAHDAVSEVFLVAWRELDDVPTSDETLPWLYGVARNAREWAEFLETRNCSYGTECLLNTPATGGD